MELAQSAILLSTAILSGRKGKKNNQKKTKTKPKKKPLRSLPNRAFTNAQKHAALALWGKILFSRLKKKSFKHK